MQIEIKVKVKDTEKLTEKMKIVGAKFWRKTAEKETYFSSKKGVFKLKESSNGECILIHDFRPKENSTTAYRTELPMDNIFSEKLHAILEDTVDVLFVLERTREQYLSHGVLLSIDRIKDHETFLELTSDEIQEKDATSTKEKLVTLLQQFGFLENDLESKSFSDMYL